MRRAFCLVIVLLTVACRRDAVSSAPPLHQSAATPAWSAPGALAASAEAGARDTRLYVDLLYMTKADIAVS
jgi:hypothetical protein